MATALIGSIGPYNESEDIDTYIDRVELFFVANSVPDDKKVATFLSILGPQVYALLQILISPTKPKDASYDVLVEGLKKHFKPKVLIVFERYKFYKRSLGPDESISNFVAGLKACAHTCDFGDKLKEQLRDRLVCGINNEATQRALLTEQNLTFEKAVEIATAREEAAKDVMAMGRQPLGVNKVDKPFSKNKHSMPKSGDSFPSKPCSGCGGKHWKSKCPFKDSVCHKCGKKGHLKKVCFSKTTAVKPKATNHHRVDVLDNDRCDLYDGFIFHSSSNTNDPLLLKVNLNGVQTNMELDTGAAKSLISQTMYNDLWSTNARPRLRPCNQVLKVYGGQMLPVLGEITVVAQLERRAPKDVNLVVIRGDGPLLMGRDLLRSLEVTKFFQPTSIHNNYVDSLSGRFSELFSPGLGLFKGKNFSLDVNPSVAPKYCKARSVPYAMRPKVDLALDKLLNDGVITPVTYSEWAAPVVPVLKPDGTVRICGDYRLTVNRAIKLDTYPIPKPTDLFSSLAGGTIFSKLDMSQAYCQHELDEKSKAYSVINTHRGLFKYNRLCFGISSAPGIFQRAVGQLLQGMPGVLCYLDDILVSGASEDEHHDRLCVVLDTLREAGLKLQLDKCSFGVNEVSYLGLTINSKGQHPTDDKVKAIVAAPEPSNLKQLESYLGMFNFYCRFVPNASTVLGPLNRLRQKNVPWSWGCQESDAFAKSKRLLLNSKALVHFNPALPISMIIPGGSTQFADNPEQTPFPSASATPMIPTSPISKSTEAGLSDPDSPSPNRPKSISTAPCVPVPLHPKPESILRSPIPSNAPRRSSRVSKPPQRLNL